jgi:hypothetical protein
MATNRYRGRYRYRSRFGGTLYDTYETDRTNGSAASITKDAVADLEAPSELPWKLAL